ncbi:hypothetical protein GXW82_31635 [Streptacidiphilus sp. 4-A2]|nr:hypothetical protein [Streptacidiphilus sp. 4-A2]
MDAESIEDLNERAGPCLRALQELIAQGTADHVPPHEGRRPFYVGWGFLASLERQARAVVSLHQAGLGHEAAPNRRLMIELMAHLEWLAQDGEDAVDSMNKAFQYKHGGLRKAADADGFEYDSGTAASADEVQAAEIPGNPTNQFNVTSKLLGRLGAKLPTVWLTETQYSHATLTGARAFFDDSDANSVRLFNEPHFGSVDAAADASLFVAFMLLFIGMEAFDTLMVGTPWKDVMAPIGIQGGLSKPDNSPS